jgi:hypothetical protein
MKAESTSRPNLVNIETYDGISFVRICDNVEIISEEEGERFIYDEVSFYASPREGLKESIETNVDSWKRYAQSLPVKLTPIESLIQENQMLKTALDDLLLGGAF